MTQALVFGQRIWSRASYSVSVGDHVHNTITTNWVYSAAFNQTEAGRQQGGKGTGLGLALVRQIVKLSGGVSQIVLGTKISATHILDSALACNQKRVKTQAVHSGEDLSPKLPPLYTD
jgi:signal transduction histidine kinase